MFLVDALVILLKRAVCQFRGHDFHGGWCRYCEARGWHSDRS